MTVGRLLVGLALLGSLTACAADDAATPPTTRPIDDADTTTTRRPVVAASTAIGPADRPAVLVAPDDVPDLAPLIMLLHGYRSSGEAQDAYLGVTAQAASRGLYVLLPDGTVGPGDNRFWDAVPACCNFSGTPVDDVGYLGALIEEAIADHRIDPDRVYLLGHSNGGFMSYRMACERADLIAAVASIAGTEQPDAGLCQPSEPVSVLHLHGTDDTVIAYPGGATVAAYASAPDTVARWAARDGCDDEPVDAGRADLDTLLEGEETAIEAYEGCEDDAEVALATLEGGSHVPVFDKDALGTDVLDWLLRQVR